VASASRYRILGTLGRGGVAEVFEARALGEHGFERRVAIKRLHHDFAQDESSVNAFIDEARIASRLHHRNIISVLDFGIMDDAPFMVMELVIGFDAGKLLSTTGPFPPALALHIAAELAHGLDHAHGLRIVHRDVAPKNVLISLEGDIKLADFGIARAGDRITKTRAGQAKGTLGYMAPEQSLGGDVDARADLFGLGCVLAALILGRSPLDDEEARLRFLRDRRLDLDRSLDAEVEEIVKRALQFDRAERYSSAAEMAEALSRAAAARLDQDARSLLEAHLASLQPSATERGDDPFDLELLLGSGPIRRFSSSVTPAETVTEIDERTRPISIEPPLEPTRLPATVVVARRSRRWPYVRIGIAALFVVAALWPRPPPPNPEAIAPPPIAPSALPGVTVERREEAHQEPPPPNPKKPTALKEKKSTVREAPRDTPVDRATIADQLARIRQAIARLPEAEVGRFESRYLDLAAQETRTGDEDLRAIAEQAAKLLRDIEARE
jgi:serine/threonine protein kinase